MKPTGNGSTAFACRSRSVPSPIALSGARERIARKTYIRARGYANPAFDRALASVQADRSWRCHEVACGHDVMIDRPDRLSEFLLEAAA